MKRNIYLTGFAFMLALLVSSVAFSQEEEDNRPIRAPFGSEILIDNQTTVNPSKGGFAMEIQHRFSKIEKIDDIFGIFGSANTRIGFNYGITDKIMIGLGTTRDYMLQDLNWKYSIITQTRSGKIPLSLSYFGNAVLDARPDENFGPTEEYRFIHRLSYLNQVIISRKFGEKVSLQIAPTFVYHNSVPEGFRNANASIYAGGRFQVLGFHAIILEYNQPILKADEDVYPNLAAGVEIGTSTHSFRVFVSNYNSIILNRSIAFNQNNFFDGDIMFGFNITIRFR
jgi:hypothetical protein